MSDPSCLLRYPHPVPQRTETQDNCNLIRCSWRHGIGKLTLPATQLLTWTTLCRAGKVCDTFSPLSHLQHVTHFQQCGVTRLWNVGGKNRSRQLSAEVFVSLENLKRRVVSGCEVGRPFSVLAFLLEGQSSGSAGPETITTGPSPSLSGRWRQVPKLLTILWGPVYSSQSRAKVSIARVKIRKYF